MSKENDISWALNILTPDPEYKENIISKYFHYLTFVPIYLLCPTFSNWINRKPLYSDAFKYTRWLTYGLLSAYFFNKWTISSSARHSAVLHKIVELYPEEFIKTEHKTFNDVFEDWIPCR